MTTPVAIGANMSIIPDTNIGKIGNLDHPAIIK